MYADHVTESMRAAIEETDRRRDDPAALQPRARDRADDDRQGDPRHQRAAPVGRRVDRGLPGGGAGGTFGPHDLASQSVAQIEAIVARMEAEMRSAAKNLEFERAAALRDEIQQVRLRVLEEDASVRVGGRPRRPARATRERRRRPERPARAPPPPGGPASASGPPTPAPLEVTEVRVLPVVGDEPADALDEAAAATAADWLPGIRDEHDDDGGWQARWLDRPDLGPDGHPERRQADRRPLHRVGVAELATTLSTSGRARRTIAANPRCGRRRSTGRGAARWRARPASARRASSSATCAATPRSSSAAATRRRPSSWRPTASMVRAVIALHEGAEIRTEGDSVYVVFPAASGAVEAGLGIVAGATEREYQRAPDRGRGRGPCRGDRGHDRGPGRGRGEHRRPGLRQGPGRRGPRHRYGPGPDPDVPALSLHEPRHPEPQGHRRGDPALPGRGGPVRRVGRGSVVSSGPAGAGSSCSAESSRSSSSRPSGTTQRTGRRTASACRPSTKDVVARIDPARNCVVAVYPVGQRPAALTVSADGSLWIANVDDWTLSRHGSEDGPGRCHRGRGQPGRDRGRGSRRR